MSHQWHLGYHRCVTRGPPHLLPGGTAPRAAPHELPGKSPARQGLPGCGGCLAGQQGKSRLGASRKGCLPGRVFPGAGARYRSGAERAGQRRHVAARRTTWVNGPVFIVLQRLASAPPMIAGAIPVASPTAEPAK